MTRESEFRLTTDYALRIVGSPMPAERTGKQVRLLPDQLPGEFRGTPDETQRDKSMLSIIVNHEPVGQPRHRISTRGIYARMYLPSSDPVYAFKSAIRAAIGKPVKISGAVEIVVNAWFPRPKSKMWKRKPMPAYRHTSKPDADNVLKAVLDALNGIAWVDDAQIVTATVRKFVCCGASSPRVEIVISSVE